MDSVQGLHRKGCSMSDAQYEVIKTTFPAWSDRVETLASRDLDQGTMGTLYGMAYGIQLVGLCGDASEFVTEAIYRAKRAQEGGAK